MTTKDCNVVAKALRIVKPEVKEVAEYAAWSRTVHVMAACLDEKSPGFSFKRFFNACGLKEEA